MEGYLGGYVLRFAGQGEVEFVVVNLFESIAAVERFAGADYAVPGVRNGGKTSLDHDRADCRALRGQGEHRVTRRQHPRADHNSRGT
jgi:hypothetical protein